MNGIKTSFLGIILAAWLPVHADSDSLWHRFVNPPHEARTKVWWFHGETESTLAGIDADLTAFKEKGIGGVVYYDQVHSKAQGAFESMSPEWWHSLKHAAQKAKELGLSFEVASSNGYSAGGPWITPELGMQQTDYIDTLITIRQSEELVLNLAHPHPWFKEVATVLFPDDATTCPILLPKASFSLQQNAAAETIYDAGRPITISGISYTSTPRGKGSTGSMNIPGHPQERYFGAGFIDLPPIGQLEYSTDGQTWHTATELPAVENNIGHKSKRRTVSFPAVTAPLFRLKIHDWMDSEGKFKQLEVNHVMLHPRDIIDNLEVKTGLRTEITYPHPIGASKGAIASSKIRNVSQWMHGDTLRMRLEPGTWRILRFGHRPTGARTKHGRKNLIGYEVDLMSPKAVKIHFNHYFKAIHDTLSALGCAPSGTIIDSHEAGIANWTPGLEKQFSSRHDYDLLPWIPAMAGYLVDNREATEAVLMDYRRTIAEAISQGLYGTFSQLCSNLGVTFTSQALLNIDADNIESRSRVDKPQGEFWAYQVNGNFDCLDAASTAHLYGKPIASAEAFTDTPYRSSWNELTRIANLAYCRGINEFVVCASSHQPWLDRKYDDSQSKHPYIFHRLNPKWDTSTPFWDYQARCAYMLRQGDPVVDLCVYIGQELPTKTFSYKLPEMPEGYNFDVCTLDALLNRMQVKNGKIILKGGMQYQALVIQDRTYLSPQAIEKIEDLTRKGATIIRCDHGEKVADRLADAGLAPDAAFTSAGLPDNKMCFYHRHTSDADIYFFYNHSAQAYRKDVKLRTNAHHYECWHPMNLTRQQGVLHPEQGFSLTLAPYESIFIIVPVE